MFLSFIICTYNRSNILINCINSIIKSKTGIDNIELIIVDNNSNDNTADVVRNISHGKEFIKYYKELNIGLSYARNRGIKEAKGDYLVFLDDDVILENDYIENLNIFINGHANIVCIAGRVIPIWKNDKPNWFSDEFFSIIAETRYGNNIRTLKEREYPVGCNMVFTKKIFNEIGYFNTELGIKGDQLFLGEEVDICDRIRKKGYELYYSPNLLCHHQVHENKVNQEYVLKRLKLEGSSIAKWHIDTLNKNSLIKALIRRYCILLARDIPLLGVSCIFRLSIYFEKRCKYLRTREYIKEVKNYLYNK